MAVVRRRWTLFSRVPCLTRPVQAAEARRSDGHEEGRRRAKVMAQDPPDRNQQQPGCRASPSAGPLGGRRRRDSQQRSAARWRWSSVFWSLGPQRHDDGPPQGGRHGGAGFFGSWPPPRRTSVSTPTAPDIHLGHTVVLRKLRDFQDAGHLVVLIVGDFTARMGDPSGRSELRPMLTPRGDRGERPHLPGAGRSGARRDPGRLELRRNSEWLDMGMASCSRSCARPPWASCWSAMISPSAGRRWQPSRCWSCSTR